MREEKRGEEEEDEEEEDFSSREVVAGEAERREAFSVQNQLWFYNQIKSQDGRTDLPFRRLPAPR